MSLPVPPTPVIPARYRDRLYGVWSWAAGLVFLATIGWASIPGQDVPVWLVVASVVVNGFGSLTGFLAKNNTP